MVSGHTGVRGEDRALERDPFPWKCVCGAGTQGECVDDLPGDQGLRPSCPKRQLGDQLESRNLGLILVSLNSLIKTRTF